MRNVIVIGGGLAGLISSIQLVRAGIACTVVEKKSYPLHRVCGEYISNEAVPFLTSSGLYPKDFDLPQIKIFELSSVSGKTCTITLDLGGFGISRFTFDHHLFLCAQKEGVDFKLETEATAVSFQDDAFSIETTEGHLSADVVIGSFGKRSKLDMQQRRKFLQKRSPYVGVKYHARTGHPPDVVALHNFPSGYAGICQVDRGVTNLCYLAHRDQLKRFGSVKRMEEEVLFTNPRIREAFLQAEFLLEKPEVINEISFETKGAVTNHMLMAGDSAGMIAPACGNGMAMAIHSGKLVSQLVEEFCRRRISRRILEERYSNLWDREFRQRLWVGRKIQQLFGSAPVSDFAVSAASAFPGLAKFIVSKTHGRPF